MADESGDAGDIEHIRRRLAERRGDAAEEQARVEETREALQRTGEKLRAAKARRRRQVEDQLRRNPESDDAP